MSVISEVMYTLPPKIISNEGVNYYLTVECQSDDYSFWVYYKSSLNGEKVAKKWFNFDEPQSRFKLEELMIELQMSGFRKLPSPSRSDETGTSLISL